jgi:hypothetical protein
MEIMEIDTAMFKLVQLWPQKVLLWPNASSDIRIEKISSALSARRSAELKSIERRKKKGSRYISTTCQVAPTDAISTNLAQLISYTT